MNRAPSLLGASVLAATLLLATGCSTTPGADAGAPATPAPAPISPSASPVVEPTEQPQPQADPTCETIIPASTVDAFTNVGLTVQTKPFRVGDIEIADGIECVWGDFSVATDQVQIFGWAPISADDAVSAQDQLVAIGWRRSVTPDGVIVTESSETTVATDDEGYGLTYLFGDGWVKYADTKQGLLLVVWPPA